MSVPVKPNCGEVWEISAQKRRVFVIDYLGLAGETITVADPFSGNFFSVPSSEINFVEEVCLQTIAEYCESWARSGNASASWWLGWYYQGTNHPKSVWYYIAAIRLDPGQYAASFEKVYQDAYQPRMCPGFDKPRLRFLTYIYEFHQYENGIPVDFIKWDDWREAINIAEATITTSAHLPPLVVDASAGCLQ